MARPPLFSLQLFAIVLVALLSSGCGNDDSSEDNNATTNNAATSTQTADMAPSADMPAENNDRVDMASTMTTMPVDPFLADCSAPTEATVETRALGTIPVLEGKSMPQTIELPEDILSLSLVASDPNDQYILAIGLFEGPEGQRFIEDMPEGYTPGFLTDAISPFPGQFYSPNPHASASTGISVALIPNNPNIELGPGTWTFDLRAADMRRNPITTELEVTAIIKRASQAPPCGVLDLHLHFTGANGWTATSAPNDGNVRAAVDHMRKLYEGIGIQIGEVTYDDVDAPMEISAMGGTNSEMHRLFAKNNYDTGVSIFFVERITGGPGGGVIGGVAGGTPGPTTLPNTVRSGVVVATALNNEPKSIGHVMAHETGHFLGLYHTSEILFGGVTDPIDDTAMGTEAGANMMYPTTPSPDSGITPDDVSISAQQGWVLRRSPSVVNTTDLPQE